MKKPMKPGDMYNAHKMKKKAAPFGAGIKIGRLPKPHITSGKSTQFPKVRGQKKPKKVGKKKLTVDSLKSTAKAMSGMPKAFARNMVGGDARAMLSKRKMKKGMKNC